VLTVDQRTGQLHAANLGDSGFLVYGPSTQEGMEVGGWGGAGCVNWFAGRSQQGSCVWPTWAVCAPLFQVLLA